MHRASRNEKQPLEVFFKKGVLRNLTKFAGKHLCQGLSFLKLWILQNFWEHLFLQNTSSSCFWQINLLDKIWYFKFTLFLFIFGLDFWQINFALMIFWDSCFFIYYYFICQYELVYIRPEGNSNWFEILNHFEYCSVHMNICLVVFYKLVRYVDQI